MQKNIKLSLILVAFLSQLHAENQYTLDAISVTASQGTTLDKKDVTDSVTVITKEALEESRVTTLNEALNSLGGMSMTQNGGPGSTSSMYVRGMDSSRILVLVDGVRYNNPTAIGASTEFSQIMLYNVEQIEIIKGSQSGVWGSDATGGVVNIVTSKAKKGLHGTLKTEYGSYNSIKTSMQTSYATEKIDIVLSGLSYTTDGFSSYEPGQSDSNYGKRYDDLGLEKDAYTNESLNLKVGYNINDKDRVEASIQSINSEINYDDWGADSSINQTILKNRFYNVAYKHKGSLHDLKLSYALSTFSRDTEDGYGESEYKGSVNELKVDDKISYLQDSFLRIGASAQKFTYEDVSGDTDKDYSATSVFITNYNKLKAFSNLNTIITQSLRYAKYDAFDDSITGKLGVKQFIHKDFYISTNIGTGYNAPTLSQLYGQYGANPDLNPEKSFTSDITLGNDIIWITGFYNEITDLIEYDWTDGYIQTSGKSKFKGIELGYKDYFFNALGVYAMYTYLETKDADGDALARRPKTQLDVKATYYFSEELDFGLSVQYIGTRYNTAGTSGTQTGEYTIANATTNFKVNKYLTYYAKIDNITDKYYQTVDGYATAGRSVYVGLVAKF
jgi:vitamin B12 transporter